MSDFLESIGEVLDSLATIPQDVPVYVDGKPPTALSSYRGYYSDLAIERTEVKHEKTELVERGGAFEAPYIGYYEPGSPKVRIKADPTVADLVEALNLAVGSVFEGYKGGQYEMHLSTDLWVSEWGDCDSRRIFRIAGDSGAANIETLEVP